MMQKTLSHYEENRPIFKDYLLKGFVGRGRYGSVYLVENRARRRALKVFNHSVKWEKDENKIINEFQSPYMIDIVDYGETVIGESCVLMEYLSLTLEKALANEGKFIERKASLYFIEILKGLQLQEMYGIIHRDIKPSNLFIVADTIKAGDHAFISTSGLSMISSNCPSHIKFSKDDDIAEAFGTPVYSAPEVFDGCYSHSADCWASAVIFFEMLTGTLPFAGETILNIMLAVMDSQPDYSLMPTKYHCFLKKCFEKNPRDRYADVEEMLAAFEDCLISDHNYYQTTFAHSYYNTECAYDNQQTTSAEMPKHTNDGTRFLQSTQRKFTTPPVLDNNHIWNLRKEPITVSEDESKVVFALDESGHPLEYIKNRYETNENENNGNENNKNSTIIDHATGLMWQRSGSEINFPYKAALDYIDQLNSKCFAGYSDWRIPTISELLSLLESEKVNGYLHISPMFDSKQQWCWSSDKRTKSSGWYVFFYSGNVNWDFLDLDNYVRGVRDYLI